VGVRSCVVRAVAETRRCCSGNWDLTILSLWEYLRGGEWLIQRGSADKELDGPERKLCSS